MDDRYYLEPSRKRGATHQILYCRLPGWKIDPGRRVKVDILVPPTLGLPDIADTDAVLINNIPVMPIFDLLVMKTQGLVGPPYLASFRLPRQRKRRCIRHIRPVGAREEGGSLVRGPRISTLSGVYGQCGHPREKIRARLR